MFVNREYAALALVVFTNLVLSIVPVLAGAQEATTSPSSDSPYIWARVVAPGETSVLDATNESVLTLVTCYPFYFIGASPRRFVVRAHKVPTAMLDRSQAGSPVRNVRPATQSGETQ
jgi:Sortase domain